MISWLSDRAAQIAPTNRQNLKIGCWIAWPCSDQPWISLGSRSFSCPLRKCSIFSLPNHDGAWAGPFPSFCDRRRQSVAHLDGSHKDAEPCLEKVEDMRQQTHGPLNSLQVNQLIRVECHSIADLWPDFKHWKKSVGIRWTWIAGTKKELCVSRAKCWMTLQYGAVFCRNDQTLPFSDWSPLLRILLPLRCAHDFWHHFSTIVVIEMPNIGIESSPSPCSRVDPNESTLCHFHG